MTKGRTPDLDDPYKGLADLYMEAHPGESNRARAEQFVLDMRDALGQSTPQVWIDAWGVEAKAWELRAVDLEAQSKAAWLKVRQRRALVTALELVQAAKLSDADLQTLAMIPSAPIPSPRCYACSSANIRCEVCEGCGLRQDSDVPF